LAIPREFDGHDRRLPGGGPSPNEVFTSCETPSLRRRGLDSAPTGPRTHEGVAHPQVFGQRRHRAGGQLTTLPISVMRRRRRPT
jgi:hypothetical protein